MERGIIRVNIVKSERIPMRLPIPTKRNEKRNSLTVTRGLSSV